MSISIHMHIIESSKATYFEPNEVHDGFVAVEVKDDKGNDVNFFYSNVDKILELADQLRDVADKLEAGSND